MPWANWRSCVGGVMLLSLMGCAGQQFAGFGFFQGAGSGAGDYVVAGSADSVAASLQASLKRVGLSAVVTEQGEDIRVASKTLKGDKFALVLTKVKNSQGESTRVRFEWENGPDAQTQSHVLASLNVQSGTASTLPTKVAQ
jgi:hypothetical protein